ncbi:ATP-binding protein, partial [Lachnospiraceae bacterium]|nr:ATP-binding protein [Lachnospiraceae bacterium]
GLMEAAGILIDNAAEAVLSQEEETGKVIRCCLKETEEKISLQIWNAGRRYSQDEMERFFRRGYSTKGSGRGLGLENVKRIMERSRGEISVENREYYGCNYLIFELTILK